MRSLAAAVRAMRWVVLCGSWALVFAAPSATQAQAPTAGASGAPSAVPAQTAGAPAATAAASTDSAAIPPAPTAAPAVPAELTDAQREQARAAYARGQALFAEGKFADALVAFDEAYAAAPNPVVLLSTAECDVQLGKLEDAYGVLQRYLTERPDAPDRAEIERKAAELASLPAVLALTSEPVGAAIKLDGQDTGKQTPAELSVSRGEHTLELTLAGHKPQTISVQARIGARHELQATLEAEPPPPPVSLKVEPAEAHKPATALWITSIVGAAGLVTGTVLGFMVLAERSDFDANPTDATAKRGERLALFTDVAFGVGAMALVTSAVLYFTADEAAQPASKPEPAARLQLTPAVLAHGAGMAASGHF
jgi:tetratricopeptide (TPR) repeat protein